MNRVKSSGESRLLSILMQARPMRAGMPFAPLLLLLAIVYLIAVLTPTSAAAGLDNAEALAAWAKSKNWHKSPYGGMGYRSDDKISFDIWIVSDRKPTLIPFNNSRKTVGRSAQTVTETGENITIAGGIPATRLYTSIVDEEGNTSFLHEDGGRDFEKWEYYCHDYRVLIRAHRDTHTGTTGSDPLALLENYIAFVNKYLNVKPTTTDPPVDPFVKKDKVALGYIMAIIRTKDGTVERLKSVKDLSGEKLKKGDVIYANDILKTQTDVMVKIIFPQKDISIMMKPNTTIRIENKKIYKQGGIFNFFGRLLFRSEGTDRHGFKIITSNAIAGCVGTEFETAYDPVAGVTTVPVFEGIVRLDCTIGNTDPVMVTAGMQATMDNNCNHTLSKLGPNNDTPAKAGWPDISIDPEKSDDEPDKKSILLESVADSHVYAYTYLNWNKANWGKYENLGAGWNPTGGEKRTFLKFDLAGIDPDNVDKAALKLYHCHTAGGNAVDIGVYRIMSPWQEGSDTYHSGQTEKTASDGEISWVNQPNIDQYPVVYFNPGQEVNKWIEVDVTPLVKAWLTGIPNHGMAIKVVENYLGKSESQYSFRSREFEDVEKRPVLMLNSTVVVNAQEGPDDFHIGSTWHVVESCDYGKWIGEWTRRPGTETFDATWKQVSGEQTGPEVRDVIDFKGYKNGIVTLYRHGIGGTYTGKISPDGKNVRDGDASWYNGSCNWTAKISKIR